MELQTAARAELEGRRARARGRANTGVALIATNLATIMIGRVLAAVLEGAAASVALAAMLFYATATTLFCIWQMFAALRIEQRAVVALRQLDGDDLPQARLLR